MSNSCENIANFVSPTSKIHSDVEAEVVAGAPARFQARVGKDFCLFALVFGLPTLDLIAWVGKDPPAVLNKS